MGDCGSTFLGAVFAGVVLQAPALAMAWRCLLVARPLLPMPFDLRTAAADGGQPVSSPSAAPLPRRLQQGRLSPVGLIFMPWYLGNRADRSRFWRGGGVGWVGCGGPVVLAGCLGGSIAR